jgi:hypothetical protein
MQAKPDSFAIRDKNLYREHCTAPILLTFSMSLNIRAVYRFTTEMRKKNARNRIIHVPVLPWGFAHQRAFFWKIESRV